MADGSNQLTVDELAAEVEMTVRNVRAHQSRGLLAPPVIVGRTGYYNASHVLRLRSIKAMQKMGMNLAAIEMMVGNPGFASAAVGPPEESEPVSADLKDLTQKLGISPTHPLAQRAVELGILSIDGDTVTVHSPGLIGIALDLVNRGVPLEAILELVDALQNATKQIADVFMSISDRYLIKAVIGSSYSNPDEFRKRLDQLKGYGTIAVNQAYDRAMTEARTKYMSERGWTE